VENAYYLSSILQSSTDTAIVATDLYYNVKYFNHAAEQLFGVPASMALKSNVERIHEGISKASDKRFTETIKKVKEQGSYSFILEHNDKTLQAELSVIKDNANECAGFLLLGHDLSARIAEEKKQELVKERLQKAEKMESLGLMAGGVAHDLNNILSGIVSYPELLLMQLPESSELREPIRAIQESGKRAATVVADLLTVARGVATSKAPHDVHLLVNDFLCSPECEKLCSLYPKIKCKEKMEAEDSIIFCSPVHIKNTLMNLVGNSMEAIDGKGTISISTCNQQLDTNEASKFDLQAGNYLILSVKDNGKGIAEKDLEHIFEPFYTKKVMGKSGTGLGLAIVWNTMQDHNGRVTVESTEHGTCFDLYFPTNVTQNIVEEKENENTALPTDTNKHILVVDDEPQLRDIACKTLESIGYQVDSVCSGELAIKFVKDNPVDLVMLDMLMEPGMNGRQTYEEILKLYPDQKAIIASGFSESDDVKAAFQLGVGGFIKKPYSVARLGRAIEEALNS